MAGLFEPYSLKGVTLRNRVVVSPMCQYMANRNSAEGFKANRLTRYDKLVSFVAAGEGAWATVNKLSGGGKKSGSGRGKSPAK